MTTEHVSVPREYVEQLQRALLGMGLREDSETLRELLSNSTQSTGHDPCTDECSENPEVRQAYANGYDVGYAHGNAILSRVTPSDGSPMECLSELMRGLEIPPAAAANMQPHGFYAIGRAIAEQAKQAGKTSAPRVVTSNDDNATSLPAARVTDGLSAWVGDMKTSAGMDYYVCVGFRDRSEYLTPNVYKIRGRAEFDVAEWNHLLGLGPKPDLLAFDTEAAAPQAGEWG